MVAQARRRAEGYDVIVTAFVLFRPQRVPVTCNVHSGGSIIHLSRASLAQIIEIKVQGERFFGKASWRCTVSISHSNLDYMTSLLEVSTSLCIMNVDSENLLFPSPLGPAKILTW